MHRYLRSQKLVQVSHSSLQVARAVTEPMVPQHNYVSPTSVLEHRGLVPFSLAWACRPARLCGAFGAGTFSKQVVKAVLLPSVWHDNKALFLSAPVWKEHLPTLCFCRSCPSLQSTAQGPEVLGFWGRSLLNAAFFQESELVATLLYPSILI